MSKKYGFISALFAIMLLVTSVAPVSASPSHEAVLKIEEAENEASIQVIIPAPEKLTSIDFTISLNTAAAVISSVSFEGCDIENSATDIDEYSGTTNEPAVFFYKYSLTESKALFSGYFINSYTKESEFILCTLKLSVIDPFAEADLAEFTYKLNCELCSKTDCVVYSLKDKKLHTDISLPSYPLGDADADGTVTASDARAILRASVGLDTLPLSIIAYTDSDYDGTITATDARYALRTSVGLEKSIIHRFDISLENGASCEHGGLYTFTCNITGKTFTIEISDGGHIISESDCFNTGKCIVCNNALKPATGHNFDENGICKSCSADKTKITEAEEKLIPILEEINTYDTLADEALASNKNSEFLENTQKATLLIKDAAACCDNIIGMEAIHDHLVKAYKLRFDAFVSITDESGGILANTKNCNIILAAIKASNSHIDYASYLYE